MNATGKKTQKHTDDSRKDGSRKVIYTEYTEKKPFIWLQNIEKTARGSLAWLQRNRERLQDPKTQKKLISFATPDLNLPVNDNTILAPLIQPVIAIVAGGLLALLVTSGLISGTTLIIASALIALILAKVFGISITAPSVTY